MNAQVSNTLSPKGLLAIVQAQSSFVTLVSTMCCDFSCIPLGVPYFKTTITQRHVAADPWLPPFLYLEV